jgi:GTP cyclohydrolase II
MSAVVPDPALAAMLARACRALQAGRPVVLSGDGARCAIWAVETSAPVPGARLALTDQRAAALGLAATGPVALPAPGEPTVLRALADPTSEGPLPEPLPAALPADRLGHAALDLCKLAGLLPAALIDPGPAPMDAPDVPIRMLAAWRETAARALRIVGRSTLELPGTGPVRIILFRAPAPAPEHLALLIGRPEDSEAPLARLHSACFTGDVLGSMRCDCGEQLTLALDRMSEAGAGVLLYLSQEGRGIGLANKLRAYRLQDAGLDTVDANRHLGFDPDERDWQGAAVMLRQLGIDRVRLLTNNPAKREGLDRFGVSVVERVPHHLPANQHNRAYLRAKALKRGHWLPLAGLSDSDAAI